MPNRLTLFNRLMEGVAPPDPVTGCWNWIRCVNNEGYGQVSCNGQPQLAHRAMYQLLVRILEPDEIVMHLCDNPRCCNPEHLEAGDSVENVRQATAHKQDGLNELQRRSL